MPKKGRTDNESPVEAARMILSLRPECWVTIRRAQVILGQALGAVVSRDYTVDFILTHERGPKLLEKALRSDMEVSGQYLPKGNRFTRAKR